MSNSVEMRITIPADNEGYILLHCRLCGEFFKLRASDCEDDGLLGTKCPNCGLMSENYLTEEVIELVMAMVHNYATDMLYDKAKQWERSLNKGPMTFKAGKRPAHKPDSPIRVTLDTLTVVHYGCCGRDAKIKPLLRITGSYCPFCGVKCFETE